MSDYLHLLQDHNDTLDNIKDIKAKLIVKMDQEYKISKNREYMSYDPQTKF
jgi:hypothetical protein